MSLGGLERSSYLFCQSSSLEIRDCRNVVANKNLVLITAQVCMVYLQATLTMNNSNFELTSNNYGKTGVRLLYVGRDSGHDDITELEVSTLLQLTDIKDYVEGDNSSIIPTDTQKNLVYIIAQKYGVGCPEEFALRLCEHFLSTYPQVVSARVKVETVHGWRRIVRNYREHQHAFISSPECSRHAEVFYARGAAPQVSAGLKGLRVLKTTKSAFVGFEKCEATTLPDAEDRVMSTVVEADWKYSNNHGLQFCDAWNTVLDCILEKFAGPPDTGLDSPSVQLTMYDAEKLVLGRVKQISEIRMSFPNVHYFEVDMTRFKIPHLNNTKNVYMPTDKPSGIINATMSRTQMSKL